MRIPPGIVVRVSTAISLLVIPCASAASAASAPADTPARSARSGPELGRSVSVAPIGGQVFVKREEQAEFLQLDRLGRLPVGSSIDVRNGAIELTAGASGGRTQTAVFSEGEFVFNQDRRSGGMTELVLTGGDFSVCNRVASRRLGTRGGGVRAAAKRGRTTRSRRSIRRLWGNGHGRFRTRGRFSSASVRGTIWLVEDRCGGTLTRVRRGLVEVCDFTRGKTVYVGAGQSYFADEPGPGARLQPCDET